MRHAAPGRLAAGGARGLACAAAGLALWTAIAASAAARDAAPARGVPAPVASAIGDARLSGEGLARWFGLRVYEARLWVGAEGLDPARLRQAPFALDLLYARQLDGQAIAETSHREIARLGFGNESQRRAWLDAMRRIFPDVREGDRLTGVHRPEAGVSFFKNDRPLGAIRDPDFAAAFFSIWLDARTVLPELRADLLAQASRETGAPR